jgi:glycosyltransferase involved in cell wall biosynthesis
MDTGQRMEKLKMAAVVPTYNNAGTLACVLDSLLETGAHVWVVNDGSTDATSAILSGYAGKVGIVSYEKNRGKGHALRKGFEKARSEGYSYAMTIDSDGQHRASSMTCFIDEVERHPDSLVVGARVLNQKGMPMGNTFANHFSNFWFRLQTGIDFPDTQSGYRVYPLSAMGKMHLFTERYETELEILVRAAWRGIRIAAVPIDVDYAPGGQRVTHFRPCIDFLRISLLNTVLTFMALTYERPKLWIKHLTRR